MTDPHLTIIMRKATTWRGLELQAGQVATAPPSLLEAVAELVERGDARPADDETRRILRAHAVGMLG
jgi:hypothetical protein